MKRLMILLLVGLPILFGQTAFAQIDRIKPGDRVRVQVSIITSDLMEGVITDISADHFMLAVDTSDVKIPWQAIDRLEVRRQKRNTVKGALIGGLSGGLVLGISAGASSNSSNEGFGPDFSGGQGFAIGLIYGGLGGGAIGALIGTFVRTDRWERIPIKVSMRAFSDHLEKFSVTPGVTLSFSLDRKQ